MDHQRQAGYDYPQGCSHPTSTLADIIDGDAQRDRQPSSLCFAMHRLVARGGPSSDGLSWSLNLYRFASSSPPDRSLVSRTAPVPVRSNDRVRQHRN
jgi:hypothetical protein